MSTITFILLNLTALVVQVHHCWAIGRTSELCGWAAASVALLLMTCAAVLALTGMCSHDGSAWGYLGLGLLGLVVMPSLCSCWASAYHVVAQCQAGHPS